MKIAMTLIAVVTIAIVILVTQNDITEQLKLEKIESAEFQIEIQKRDNELNQLEKELQELIDDKEKTESEKEEEIERLKRELQAKNEANDRAKIQQREVASQVSTNCEDYRGLVEQYSGWDVNTMLHAMSLESGCNPLAVGDQYVIGGIYAPSCGLLQVRTLDGRPSCDALKDPATNIKWAHKIWQSQSYSAWTTLH